MQLRASLKFLFLCFLTLSSLLVPNQARAVYEGVRDDIGYDYTNRYKCDTGTIAFDPFSNNKDYNIELTNPVCISFMLGAGAVVEAASYASKILCTPSPGNLPATIRGAAALEAGMEGPPLPPYPNVWWPVKIAMRVSQCAGRSSDSAVAAASYPSSAAIASADASKCCAGAAALASANAAAVAALAVTYAVAKNTYDEARICGHDWQQWVKDDTVSWKLDKGPYRNCIEALFTSGGIVPSYCSTGSTFYHNGVASCSYGEPYTESSGQLKCRGYGINSDTAGTADAKVSIGNKYYREFIYGGMEYEDAGDGACSNPWSSSGGTNSERYTHLGYNDDKQKYYMKGAGAAPVYACYRFLTSTQTTDTQRAYDCCKRRSQNALCIENRRGVGVTVGPIMHEFCEVGSRCEVASTTFEVYASKERSNYVCAKTYSVCPYNHLLAGGTEMQSVDPSNTALVKNFCQFMNHCSKVPVLPYVRTSNLDGAFISSSCRDMKGDSQNVYGYTAQLLPINNRGFSAPIAQCFKETMQNIFLNKAGYSKCINPDETPTAAGTCISGYIYQKGAYLSSKSFFTKIQDNLQSVIKLSLTMSIMFYGFMILRKGAGGIIEKKELLPYIVKIALVLYFATGDAWQFGFMNGVLGTSSLLSDITFQVDESGDDSTLDGCQFPRFNYGDTNESTKYDNPAYASGNDYLRIFDTLDCKLARALGFGPEVSVPNLVFMILGGFFTGGLGVIFFIGSFCFAFFMLSLTIRALHIFILSITSVIILMYISPIAITCSLFSKTKSIFDNWWKQIMGFTLQPMILFAYLGILISLFDKMVIGEDVTFTGTGTTNPKQIVCNSKAENSSIYCIFRVSDIKTFNGFEALGIGLPMLGSMNGEKLQTIIKTGIIMFVFMQFMDKISDFAFKLVAGKELQPGGGGVGKMAQSAYGALRGIQQRGMNAAKKHGGTIARKGISGAKGIGRDIADGGKSVSTPKATGVDHATNKSNDAGHVSTPIPPDTTPTSGGTDHLSSTSPQDPDHTSR